jgi:hypothetical protein
MESGRGQGQTQVERDQNHSRPKDGSAESL